MIPSAAPSTSNYVRDTIDCVAEARQPQLNSEAEL